MVDRVPQHGLGLCLDRVVDRERHVQSLTGGGRVKNIDRAPGRISDDGLAARLPRELVLEPELEPGEAVIVGSRVAHDLRRNLVQRVDPLLFIDEPESDDPQLLELGGLERIGLAHEIDEPARAVGEQPQHLVGVGPERVIEGGCGRRRVTNLARVRVDGRRLAADRELNSRAVVDRPAASGIDDRRPVLVLGEPRVAPRHHSLQPGRAHEHRGERQREHGEDEPDSPVRQSHLPRSR